MRRRFKPMEESMTRITALWSELEQLYADIDRYPAAAERDDLMERILRLEEDIADLPACGDDDIVAKLELLLRVVCQEDPAPASVPVRLIRSATLALVSP